MIEAKYAGSADRRNETLSYTASRAVDTGTWLPGLRSRVIGASFRTLFLQLLPVQIIPILIITEQISQGSGGGGTESLFDSFPFIGEQMRVFRAEIFHEFQEYKSRIGRAQFEKFVKAGARVLVDFLEFTHGLQVRGAEIALACAPGACPHAKNYAPRLRP